MLSYLTLKNFKCFEEQSFAPSIDATKTERFGQTYTVE